MPFPTVEAEAYHRLHRAGWTLGIYSLTGPQGVVCVMDGVDGENLSPAPALLFGPFHAPPLPGEHQWPRHGSY